MTRAAGTRRGTDTTQLELVGGPEAITVSLEEYDPRWPDVFEVHRARIARALASQPPAGAGDPAVPALDGLGAPLASIEHIGSTAVPGLAAKPIVDIVVAVLDITDEPAYLAPLLEAGYVLRVREPGHRLVRTPSRDVHVHLYEVGAPAIDEYLLLRDHLRADEADRSLYESTKRTLLERDWSDMNDYADAKTEVIAAIKGRARAAAERTCAATARVDPAG